MPTAIVVGDEDYATPPAMAKVLNEGIAGSSLQILRGARHLTPLECPDVIADILVQLLSKENK
jgi:pimeloyl-ACP methyl ester carboxylesterase